MTGRGSWRDDNWRTGGNSRDKERDRYYDDYDYDSRDSYPDRGEFYQHSKRGKNSNKDNSRPTSSSSDYRSERDGYGTDNSTSSEPPPNDRKNSQKSDKSFVKNPKKDNRESTDGAVPSQPNSQNSNKSKTEPQKTQTQSISKDEKKPDKLITPKNDNSGSKTEIPKRNEPTAKSSNAQNNSQEKIQNKEPNAPKHPVTNKEPSAPKLPVTNKEPSAPKLPVTNKEPSAPKLPVTNKEPSAPKLPVTNKEPSAPKLPVTNKEPSAPKLPVPNKTPPAAPNPNLLPKDNKKSANPSNQGTTKPLDQGTTKPLDKGTTKPLDQGTNKPQDQGTNKPQDQGTNKLPDKGTTKPLDQGTTKPLDKGTTKPLDQGTNKPQDQGTNKPQDQGTNKLPDKGTTKPLDQGTTKPLDQGTTKPLDQGTNKPQDQGTNKPQDQGTNKLPDKGTNEPLDKGINKPLDQGINKPLDQGTTKPQDKGTNEPLDKGINKPLDQGINKPLDQGTTKPQDQGTTKPQDQGTAPTPSNPPLPQSPKFLPDSNKEKTNQSEQNTSPPTTIQLPPSSPSNSAPLTQNDTLITLPLFGSPLSPTNTKQSLSTAANKATNIEQESSLEGTKANSLSTNEDKGEAISQIQSTQNINKFNFGSAANPLPLSGYPQFQCNLTSQGINASPTQPGNIFQPDIGFSIPNPPNQIPNASKISISSPPFQENKDIPGPATNRPSLLSNTFVVAGQEKSENTLGIDPISQGTIFQQIGQMSPVQTGGKPQSDAPDNLTNLQHPPIDNTKSNEDITEASREQNSINTRPSHQPITPISGANDPTYLDSSSKALVSQNPFRLSTTMSKEDPSQLLERISQLDSEVETQKSKVSEVENKEKYLLNENITLKADIIRISKELEQRKKEVTAKDKEKQNVSNILQAEEQKVARLESEKKKTTDELKASKKECEDLKVQVRQSAIDLVNNKAQTQKLDQETQAQAQATKIADLESNSKKNSKELEAKQKEFNKLKESHSIEIKELKKAMEVSKTGDTEVNEQKKEFEAKEYKLKQTEEELQFAQTALTEAETKFKASLLEIAQLKQQTAQLTNEEVKLKETISQLQAEKHHNAARMKSCVDLHLLTKIEEVFIGLSKQQAPHELTPGSPDRVEWFVASLTSWNAQLSDQISSTESLLHEKETEVYAHKGELQAILNFLHQQRPTNKSSSTTISTSSPLKLIQDILTERTDQLAKANVSITELERYNKTMEMQICDTRQHYKDESKKNDQLMQDNADLERRVQSLTCEKEELEIKNVELINQLSGVPSDVDNFNDPNLQCHDTNPNFVQESFNHRPSPLPLGMVSPFPFEPPGSPLPTFSLTQGHRSTLQKAADELSHLKVRVWESEAENSKLREQLSACNRDPSLPAAASPDAESAFQAVFEANQSNLMKLGESNREKELLSRDVEFLRQRVEELEKNIERHKVSIEVKEVAYKELYSECREWERKYKKCGHIHQEMERVKRQLMRREAETQECATLRAERLNQQTTLDNLVAELQERKKAEQILTRENQKLHAKLEECLQHISNMQLRIQEQTIAESHRNPKPEETQHLPVPHPVSPTILKPPSMSSVPLSPPTRQPATKRHPPILYPPTSS